MGGGLQGAIRIAKLGHQRLFPQIAQTLMPLANLGEQINHSQNLSVRARCFRQRNLPSKTKRVQGSLLDHSLESGLG